MKSTLFLSISAALLIGSPAAAQAKGPESSPGAMKPAAAAPADSGGAATTPKKICRRLPSSGTRMEERACLTAEEWKKIEEDR